MILRQEHPSQDLKEAREHVSRGKAFQEEGTARAKALRQDCVGTSPGSRPVALGRVSQQKVGDREGRAR